MKIKDIKAIEILDSRGNPTLKTIVILDDGTVSSSSVPSGASTGSHEAVELRDADPIRYDSKGVLKAVNNVNEKIKNALIDQNADPKFVDEILIKLDNTENKSGLGANAILSVSQAVVKATALFFKKPLWKFINEYYFSNIKPRSPKIMLNIINGGRHADWNFDIQEFIVIPERQLATEAIRVGSEIYQTIKKNLKEKKLSILVGDEGGFSPLLKSNEEVFQLIIESAKKTGYENGKDYRLAIDGAASEFYINGKYVLKKDGREISGEELSSYYLSLEEKYNLYSFEDVFHEDDWDNWSKFKNKMNPNNLLVGDDLFCTNIKRMEIGQNKKAANAVIIKPNQIGSIYETVQAINLAKKYGWAVAVSHRSGETEDSFIADLAVACAADFLKTGAPARSERLTKYNRLIEIENHL